MSEGLIVELVVEDPGACPVADVEARDGSLSVTVHATDVAEVRAAVESLRERYDGVRVARLRRDGDEGGDYLVLIDRADLTQRQREVLRRVHEMGYFAYQKGANAGEVAAELDISPSTFSEHLAAAQGKLMEAVLEGE